MMASLGSDLDSVAFKDGVEQGFWGTAYIEGDVVFVPLYAPDERTFLARLDCAGYGAQAIQCLFVDPNTKRCDLCFWPDGNQVFEGYVKFRYTAGTPFVCWPQDRGAFDIGNHADWRGERQWAKEANQVVAYLNFLRRLLHVPAYGYHRKSLTTPSA
jgi:hypothetical protein